MTPTERANSTWMNCMHDTGQKTCRACIAAAITEAVAEERARCAKVARNRPGGIFSREAALEIAAEIEKG